ncbi:hypothetical protein PRIPAC_81908 [Pristionchus pacificus]|uniref:Uncharacterized protein n=1 Tax=Pristionchus pacificus TaxID=54126 RepID=A0A2A6CLF9_PRIPA|nr:hypothetical protein PRIPAC_81908 [Pristionchus pacificus]|eukprot:PDM78949.1 hypothetical protein PRIPAC_31528 [Pristionchus pacificus]
MFTVMSIFMAVAVAIYTAVGGSDPTRVAICSRIYRVFVSLTARVVFTAHRRTIAQIRNFVAFAVAGRMNRRPQPLLFPKRLPHPHHMAMDIERMLTTHAL